MEMIAHQTKGMYLPAGFGASLAQRGEEPLPILIIAENGFPPVAAAHHMINRAGILDSNLARHAGTMIFPPRVVNTKNRPLSVFWRRIDNLLLVGFRLGCFFFMTVPVARSRPKANAFFLHELLMLWDGCESLSHLISNLKML
jgi:hypothetical protein